MSSFIGNNSSSSSGGSETLKQTLALGNVTDGYNIQVSTNDKIIGQTDLVFNVPTASTYIFKINNTNEIVLNATTLDLQNNALTTTGSGTLNSLTLSSLGLGIAHLSGGGAVSSSLLVDADVSASAAISGSKVSPDFSAQNIITTGVASLGSTPATAGGLRLGNALDINFRNAANSANIRSIGVDSSNNVLIGNTSAANTTLDLATSGVYTFKVNSTTEMTLNATTLDLQNNAITTTGAGTVNSLTVSSLGTGIGHYSSGGALTSSLIVNADVNAAAAIAGSKVAPDFGAQDITTSGNQTITGATGFLALRSTPATAGSIRLSNNSGIFTRNAGDTANVRTAMVDTSNILQIGDTNNAGIVANCATGTSLSFQINSVEKLNVSATKTTAAALAVSALGTGIGHLDSSGNLTSSLIVAADINASAAILKTQLAAAVQTTLGLADTSLQPSGFLTQLSLAGLYAVLFGAGPGATADPNISSGTTTVNADTTYVNVTITSTAKLIPNGVIRVQGRTKLNGGGAASINRNGIIGNNGAASTTGGAAPTIPAGQLIVQGSIIGGVITSPVGGAGTTTNGTQAGASSNLTGFGGNGGLSPTAGAGANGTGATGRAGGLCVTTGKLGALYLSPPIFCTANSNAPSANNGGATGASGGGGGGDLTAGPGGASGGVGGGIIWWYTAELETDGSTAASAIQSLGGAGGVGGTPAAGNRGGGAPGGGGGGGPIYLVIGKRIGSAVTNLIDSSGGAGGNGGDGTGTGTGSPGGTGGDGGQIVVIDLTAGTITSLAGVVGTAGTANSGTTHGNGGAGGVTRLTA